MNELLSVGSGQSPSESWWDSDYQYRREITFGTSHDTMPQGYTCTFTMDTTVASLASGDDVRIVWQTETDMTELDRVGDVWNSENTKISFAVQSEIPENAERGTGKYYVYYGNGQASSPPTNPQNVYIFFDDFNRPDSETVGNSWVEDELWSSTISLYGGQLKIYESKKRYAHIEQSMPEDSMEVTCKIKPSSMTGLDWSPSLDIFWNDSNGGNHIQMLTLDSGELLCKVVSDGTADTTSFSGTVSANQYNWVRIRFTDDSIYFDYGGTGDTPIWQNKLTKTRPAQLSGPFSKIILGKGIEEGSYTNPDLDNSSSMPGTKSNQYIDDISVRRCISNPPESTLQQLEMYEGGGNENYTFTYDDMGNMITKSNDTDTWFYTYDKRNRLIQVDLNQQTIAEYTYDGDGRRIKKTEWIESLQQYQDTAYVYSGINVIYEKNITTGQYATYV
jgi:YD repeat-containing protein